MNEPILMAAARALAEVVDEIVIVGGSAFRLFVHHPLAGSAKDPLLSTEDIDIAVPARGQASPIKGLKLLEALEKENFEADPPESCLGKRTYGFRGSVEVTSYLQFITPRGAPGRKGTGARVLGGLELNELKGVRLLLESPWRLNLDGSDSCIRVACPAAFLIHKLLVIDRRVSLGQRGKDLVYAYATVRLFAANLTDLAERAGQMGLKPKETRTLEANMERYLKSGSNELAEASRILASVSTRVQPSTLAATIQAGMKKVLGPHA